MRIQLRGFLDRNEHRRKAVGKGKRVSWGGAWTEDKGREHNLTEKMFLRGDTLKSCLKKTQHHLFLP